MLNKEFCYWLQGYFEIAEQPRLCEASIKIIQNKILCIDEPLGVYTRWLSGVLEAIETNNYHQPVIDIFTNHISQELNKIFIHDIDNSYATEHSSFYLHQLHAGVKIHDKY